MRALLKESALIELCSAAYHQQQTASNLLKFGRLAMRASERGATLKEFIAELSLSKRELREEGESPLADDDYDAVRVMTIHKSKGLEFPVVFLPNLAGTVSSGPPTESVRVGWSDGGVGLRLQSLRGVGGARALLDEEESARQFKEELRVLYVAMTRPRESLILLGGSGRSSRNFSALLDGPGGIRAEEIDSRTAMDVGPGPGSGAAPAVEPDAEILAAAWIRRRSRAREAARPLLVRPS